MSLCARKTDVRFPPSLRAEVARVARGLAPILRGGRGYRGLDVLTDPLAGSGTIVSFWETEADARATEGSPSYIAQMSMMSSFLNGPLVPETYEVDVREPGASADDGIGRPGPAARYLGEGPSSEEAPADRGAGAAFWAIEHVMRRPGGEESSGLLCLPLPWEEGERIEGAVAVFESRALAEAGLRHYLARTGGTLPGGRPDPSYRLLALGPRELAGVLEARPQGFERVVVNPILSRRFPAAEGYSAGIPTDDFLEALKRMPTAAAYYSGLQ